ncbi:hypothetical protein PV05_09040 [Exophiala xenobiotica]|uniref:Uncharacterized protein n=1 Tax=Exophiala xenobiotica TaxID=348802 RepID=A0A0D2BLQ8_9EURO|nr:uncharacterized protein PV05_09040 [Exophiala xenobiotica]KIW53466.1 hypothetical protein PV05_09040 [Exophiala xenobiotica]
MSVSLSLLSAGRHPISPTFSLACSMVSDFGKQVGQDSRLSLLTDRGARRTRGQRQKLGMYVFSWWPDWWCVSGCCCCTAHGCLTATWMDRWHGSICISTAVLAISGRSILRAEAFLNHARGASSVDAGHFGGSSLRELFQRSHQEATPLAAGQWVDSTRAQEYCSLLQYH